MTYGFGELDELVLAYATTIHKSQGSEYPAVVIPLTTQHYPMLQRNLLYTAVTRGKRLVVIVGQKKAMAIAVKGKQTAAEVVEAEGVAGPMTELIRSVADKPATAAGTSSASSPGEWSRRIVRARRRTWMERFLRARPRLASWIVDCVLLAGLSAVRY